MTDQPNNNPLALRKQASAPAAFVSTDASVQALHEHCAKLNRMNWVVASDKPYLVRFNPSLGKHEVYRYGEILETPSV